MREYFINPYTFVPLSEKPVFSLEESTHAWFNPGAFTGRITCELELITPTVIPGQEPGTNEYPGKIETYRYDGHLAIPGSRLRGHLMNLMRAVNSSLIGGDRYEDRTILERDKGDHKKGFTFRKKDGSLWVQQIEDEVLVAHPGRRGQQRLHGDATIQHNPVISGTGGDIPLIGSKSPFDFSQGEKGDVHWAHPNWGPQRGRGFRKYHTTTDSLDNTCGRWVKIKAWSGQDGENVYAPMNDNENSRMVHRNAWHLVNLEDLGNQYKIDHMLETYRAGVLEMARLAGDRQKREDKECADSIRNMDPIEEGMFVYFESDGSGKITSIGRHYRYLFRKGSVEDKVKALHATMKMNAEDKCLVDGLSGWANESDGKGQKGRVYVEMAIGPKYSSDLVPKKNLRILSSQPPKSANFYLDKGDYNDSDSCIRGRKFYWHDKKWKKKMWDNEDLNEGDHAFENPEPSSNKKQWSNAEVIMATEEQPVPFKFIIRCVNLSENEKNILLTALVGFDAVVQGDTLRQSHCKNWCHKIGHARPFMGSGVIRISEAEELDFDKYGKPVPRTVSLEVWRESLSCWQKKFDKCSHIPALKRVMCFGGAYEDLKPGEEGARIAYPLGQTLRQEGVYSLTWDCPPRDRPKAFEWFGNNPSKPLPLPQPGNSQALKVWVEHAPGRGAGGGTPRGRDNRRQHHTRPHQPQRQQRGTTGDTHSSQQSKPKEQKKSIIDIAFEAAKKKKEDRKGRKG